jgi:hypothetical protein
MLSCRKHSGKWFHLCLHPWQEGGQHTVEPWSTLQWGALHALHMGWLQWRCMRHWAGFACLRVSSGWFTCPAVEGPLQEIKNRQEIELLVTFQYYVIKCPRPLCTRQKGLLCSFSWIMCLLDDASLGRCAPWMMCPWLMCLDSATRSRYLQCIVGITEATRPNLNWFNTTY